MPETPHWTPLRAWTLAHSAGPVQREDEADDRGPDGARPGEHVPVADGGPAHWPTAPPLFFFDISNVKDESQILSNLNVVTVSTVLSNRFSGSLHHRSGKDMKSHE